MKCRTKNASYIYEVGETIEITVLTTKQTTKGTVGTKSINVVRILTRIWSWIWFWILYIFSILFLCFR